MKILNKEILRDYKGTRIIKLEIESVHIAASFQAGQFVVLMVSEEAERLPLTIVDSDKKTGVITVIFQEVGFSTKLLARLNRGDSLYALVGPLGLATEIKKYGKVIFCAGGVGAAEIYPVAKAFKEVGNHITVVLGARNKELLILEKELKPIADEFQVTTDDGSYGSKGFVTDILNNLLRYDPNPKPYAFIYAVGPIPMMKAVSIVSKTVGIKTIVSLNALMVDATGMCGCCRVSVGGETKFSCIDGPEFDGTIVDWQELEKRNKSYCRKEEHICRLNPK
jgi:ferredoxin--NADP+ reductase